MTCITNGWRRISVGHYAFGEFSILSYRKNEWWVFENGRLWGRWRQRGRLRVYRPYRALWEARAAVGAAREMELAA